MIKRRRHRELYNLDGDEWKSWHQDGFTPTPQQQQQLKPKMREANERWLGLDEWVDR